MADSTSISERPFDSGDDLPPIAGSIGPSLGDSSLEGLRARLNRSRAERGTCPDLIELQQDFLPTLEEREGRDERARHFERCAVCHHQIHTWKNSLEGRAAYALALSQVIGHHLSTALRRASASIPRAKRPVTTRTVTPLPPPSLDLPSPTREAPNVVAMPIAPRPIPAPRPAVPPPSAPPVYASAAIEEPRVELEPIPARAPSVKPKKRAAKEAMPPLLVLEAPPPGVVPKSLLLAVGERGGAVVTVPNVDEVLRDPDFGAVRVLVLSRSRPLAEWPNTIQRVRDQAPGRLVLAVVPVPRFGPAAVSWGHDPSILIPPVAEKDWGPALERGGWSIRK